MKRENYYILLELPIDPPEDDLQKIEAAIKAKQKLWSQQRNHATKGKQAQQYLEMIQDIKKVMLGTDRAKEARDASKTTKLAEKEKYEKLDQFLEMACSKGYLDETEFLNLVKKFSNIPEKEIRKRVKVPIQRGGQKKAAEKTLDKTVIEKINDLLKILGHNSLYDFLGLKPSSRLSTIQNRIHKKDTENRQISKKGTLVTAAGELIGHCTNIFQSNETKAVYDATLEKVRLSQLDEFIEVIGADKKIDQPEYEALVKKGKELGLDESAVKEYLLSFCEKNNWFVHIEETQKKGREPQPEETGNQQQEQQRIDEERKKAEEKKKKQSQERKKREQKKKETEEKRRQPESQKEEKKKRGGLFKTIGIVLIGIIVGLVILVAMSEEETASMDETASAPKATLVVRSNISNDKVFVNDQLKGSTRLDLKLTPGQYRVRVEKTGYGAFEETVNLTPGQNLVLRAKLSKNPEAPLSPTTTPSKPSSTDWGQQPTQPTPSDPSPSQETQGWAQKTPSASSQKTQGWSQQSTSPQENQGWSQATESSKPTQPPQQPATPTKSSEPQQITLPEKSSSKTPCTPKPGADLRHCNFAGKILDRANFKNAQIAGVSFKKASLQNANFNAANCQKADFSHANLQGSTFANSNCNQANFTKSDLREVNFKRANLNKANFNKSDIRKANFKETKLRKANYQEASLWEGANFENIKR
ncbi:MAG: pentapeptide repeat-containing protein [SAR324 cluster bacterium]|nr:pentapeptide repeat-containing protein [SAR324 cluster bacterium]